MVTEATRARVPARGTTITSVDRALRVIEYMATLSAQGETLADIAAALSMNKSSLHHTLATLRARHWVAQDQDGRYYLGPASSVIVHWWTASDSITAALHPVLERICAESHELVHLGQLSEKFVTYLDKVEPDRAVRVWSQVGRRVPAAITAMGRALLGTINPDEEELATWLDAVPSPPASLRQRVTEEVKRVHTYGYAIEIEENEPGIACVGIPLLIAGQPVAAISVTMPVERCSRDRLRELAALLARIVHEAQLPEITVASPAP